MLLNAFTRSESAYLQSVLKKPLETIYPQLTELEVDPERIEPEKRPDLLDNEARLKRCCLVLLDSFISSKDSMPHSLRRMCAFIRHELERRTGTGSPVRRASDVCPIHGRSSGSQVRASQTVLASIPESKLAADAPKNTDDNPADAPQGACSCTTTTTATSSDSPAGYLSISEKVCGAFLFLRYLIPGWYSRVEGQMRCVLVTDWII